MEKEGSKTKKRTKEEEIEKEGRRSGWDAEKAFFERKSRTGNISASGGGFGWHVTTCDFRSCYGQPPQVQIRLCGSFFQKKKNVTRLLITDLLLSIHLLEERTCVYAVPFQQQFFFLHARHLKFARVSFSGSQLGAHDPGEIRSLTLYETPCCWVTTRPFKTRVIRPASTFGRHSWLTTRPGTLPDFSIVIFTTATQVCCVFGDNTLPRLVYTLHYQFTLIRSLQRSHACRHIHTFIHTYTQETIQDPTVTHR